MAQPDPRRRDLVFTARLRGQELTFHSTWGLFSPKAIDEGTALLAGQLQIEPNCTALDLGCGYGPLGLLVASLAPAGSVDLVDKDFVAVGYAAKNAQLNGLGNARCYLSNGFDQIPAGRTYDLIVSNLPAKIGGEQLSILLEDALPRLRPGGQLCVVSISGLKEYLKRHLTAAFGNYQKLKQSKTYTAARAIKAAGN